MALKARSVDSPLVSPSASFDPGSPQSSVIRTHVTLALVLEIEIEIVYNMYRMRRFTPNAVCAGCCLWALPTMPYRELTSQA
jgi:hypothetical protein